MLCHFAVINKDVTSEEVQRVEDLVTYLEGQNSETGLQKQVLLWCCLQIVTSKFANVFANLYVCVLAFQLCRVSSVVKILERHQKVT